MTKTFHLYRTLKCGMQGEDVKKLQKWLNTVNLAYSFSTLYPNGVPENGIFQTFILNVFYHEFLRWIEEPINHVYDKYIHETLCGEVNAALVNIGDSGTTWTT